VEYGCHPAGGKRFIEFDHCRIHRKYGTGARFDILFKSIAVQINESGYQQLSVGIDTPGSDVVAAFDDPGDPSVFYHEAGAFNDSVRRHYTGVFNDCSVGVFC
jgi:hypothetical protein